MRNRKLRLFSNDATESVDTDGNGIGDNTDTDDDGDGVLDTADDYPLDNSKSWLPRIFSLNTTSLSHAGVHPVTFTSTVAFFDSRTSTTGVLRAQPTPQKRRARKYLHLKIRYEPCTVARCGHAYADINAARFLRLIL